MNKLFFIISLFWIALFLARFTLDWNPNEMVFDHILSGPTNEAWLGMDDYGRSIATRLVDGLVNSSLIVLLATLVSSSIGILIGMTSGYLGGRFDQFILFIINLFMSFPGILLAIAFAAVLSPGKLNLILALSIGGWVGYARLARSQTLSIKNIDFVKASQTMGGNNQWILFKHIFPNLRTPLIVEGTYALASLVIAEASLSFLGLGLQAPDASWGGMMRDSVRYLLVAPHYAIFVGLSIMSVVFWINSLGDYVHNRWNING